MPNPVLNPAVWAPGATWTVDQSEFLALDVTLQQLDEESAGLVLTLPAGAEARVQRDPGNWVSAGTTILTGGAWAAGPVVLGNWSIQILAGAAETDPVTLSVSNNDGLSPQGVLRIVVNGLGGAATVAPQSGSVSIDRVLADPSLLAVQVASGLPVRERASVMLSASPIASVAENGGAGLTALPPLLTVWAEAPANAVAVSDFVAVGASASFTAPGIYSETLLEFTVTAAYDLAANGTIDPTDPQNAETLPITVETVNYGLVIVLDRSGSMARTVGGTSQWVIATRAAHACADLFRAFRPGGAHMAGVVTFEHDSCTWSPTPAGNIALRSPTNANPVAALEPLAGFGNATDWNLGNPRTCTPIGDALVHAWERLGTTLAPNDRGAVILLTDGYENAGTTTIAAIRGQAAQTFAEARVAPGAVGTGNTLIGPNVYTLAIGQSVDEDRLNDLGTAIYHRTDAVNEIRIAFAQMLGDVIDAQEEMAVPIANDPAPPPHPLYYQTGSGEKVLALLVNWSAASDNLRVGWRAQGSAGAFTLLDPADPAVTFTQRGSHGLMRVDLAAPPFDAQNGIQWRLEHLNATNVAQPLSVEDALVMVDLSTKIEVSFDRPEYYLDDPINLTARIRKGGAPVTGATVHVDVARPGEGLGTFLATHAQRHKSATAAEGFTALQLDRRRQGDAPTGKGLMFTSLLSSMGLTELPVVTPPDFELFDDGAHGVGRADDGDYTGAFTDTVKEGTYSFRFRVSGDLPDGSSFSRVFVRSTWVGVRPDPALLNAVWTTLEVGSALLTFTPRSRSGEFLGPFREAAISLSIVDGELDGPLNDNLDGSYSQRVRAAPRSDPLVSISVYGTPMHPTSPVRAGSGRDEDCWSLLVRALLCPLRRLVRLLTGRS